MGGGEGGGGGVAAWPFRFAFFLAGCRTPPIGWHRDV